MNRQTETFVNNLTEAARNNPLAAALIGGGALWLLLGNRGFGAIASGAASAAQPVAEAGMRGASRFAEGLADASTRATGAISETARSVARAAGDAATSGAAAISEPASEGFNRTVDALDSSLDLQPYFDKGYSSLEKSYASAQSALTDLLERQPLVLGAIGLAIGAGVASAIASTSIEDEWAGSISDEVKDAVKGRAEQLTETAKRAVGEAGSEFRAAATETADKLRKTGEEAVRAVKETADAGREF